MWSRSILIVDGESEGPWSFDNLMRSLARAGEVLAGGVELSVPNRRDYCWAKGRTLHGSTGDHGY
jgi:hypothetical protein